MPLLIASPNSSFHRETSLQKDDGEPTPVRFRSVGSPIPSFSDDPVSLPGKDKYFAAIEYRNVIATVKSACGQARSAIGGSSGWTNKRLQKVTLRPSER